jgi:hypothetical protein
MTAAAALVGAAADAAAGTAATSGLIGTAGSVTAAGLASGATLASSVVGGVGSIMQGQAASAAAGYNAQVAANNAKISTQNAQFAGAEGEQNVAAATAKTRAQVGATVASQGASGVDVNSGSAVDTRESEAKLGMLNALNIRSQAARQAYGFETQSAAFTGQQSLAKAEASNDTTAGYLNAGATVLGGTGKAAQYSNFLNKGDPTAGITGEAPIDEYTWGT